MSSVLHKLNTRSISEIRRATLSSIVHNRGLKLLLLISNGYCRVNWVVVTTDSECVGILALSGVRLLVFLGPQVDLLPLLHLKSIRVGPKVTTSFKLVKHFPVHDDIF
jgi:hypothetical protein